MIESDQSAYEQSLAKVGMPLSVVRPWIKSVDTISGLVRQYQKDLKALDSMPVKTKPEKIGKSPTKEPWKIPNNNKYRCYYCRREVTPNLTGGHQSGYTLTKDHIIPISKGGKNTVKNRVHCCRSCNGIKANLTLEEFIRVIVLLKGMSVKQKNKVIKNIKPLIKYRDKYLL